MSQKKLIITLVVLAFSLFGVMTVYFFNQELNKRHLPVLSSVGEFKLLDSNGQEFGLSNLKSKIWIADFFFTTCSDICPMMTKNMATLYRSFLLEKDVAFVSFTVNPEYDSAGVLSQYAQKFNADTSKWHFLTGPRGMIQDIAVKSFKLGDIHEPVFHSSYFVLVDRKGQIRGYYGGMKKEELPRLFKDLAYLIKERPHAY